MKKTISMQSFYLLLRLALLANVTQSLVLNVSAMKRPYGFEESALDQKRLRIEETEEETSQN